MSDARAQAREIRRRVLLTGEVQGVGFRASTTREAELHPSVRGFVRNLADGRVEAVFQGPEAEVLALVAWCERGPAPARVLELRVIEESPEEGLPPGFSGRLP